VKALFFSPFSNVWEHSYPVSLIAKSLEEQGFDIEFVNCDGQFEDFCIAMSAAGLTAESAEHKRKQVCVACRKRRNLLAKEFGFRSHNLENFIDSSDIKYAAEQSKQVNPTNWMHLEVHGIPIGRYAAYEFLLHYKILGTNIPEKLFPFYQDQLRLSIITLLASQKLLEDSNPDVVLTYNRLYGVNHAFLAVAERRNIPTYSLQGGAHITLHAESMTLFKDSQSLFQVLDSTTWQTSKEKPIGRIQAELVSSHLMGLLNASSAFAYSSSFEGLAPAVLREKLSIRPGSPVLLVPMSSEDELNAAELADFLPERESRPNLFEDQFSWIRYIFDFARRNPELTFVLRLHPRMYPNKREGILAPVVEKVIELLKEAPNNVSINYPTDGISLYDLLQIVDVVLGYRSTVGVEAASFGIPVVAPANKDFFTYPREISLTSYSLHEFDKNIYKALQEGWSFENARKAFRWFSFLFTRVATDLSGSVHSKPIAVRPKKQGFKLLLWKKLTFFIIQYGPLLRERVSLLNKGLPEEAKSKIFDVVSHFKNNLSEANYPSGETEIAEEDNAISDQLSFFLEEFWSEIVDENSLAYRIRDFLKAR
jgi:hypothetical protein